MRADPSGELILRRQQSADGRSRAFCNDQAIGVNLLKQIGSGAGRNPWSE